MNVQNPEILKNKTPTTIQFKIELEVKTTIIVHYLFDDNSKGYIVYQGAGKSFWIENFLHCLISTRNKMNR